MRAIPRVRIPPEQARRSLIVLLRLAHAGERAAAYAYRGHAASVRDPLERVEIRTIEEDEWRHRRCLWGMLASLGVGPSPLREVHSALVGRVISLLCRLGGWFLPMWGAGRLERGNIAEYEIAARLALCAGQERLVEDLLQMAEVEWDHERYFRGKASSHTWWRVFPRWDLPASREEIRRMYEAFARGALSSPPAGQNLPATVV